MIPRNAVVSIARPSCGTRPSWNSARRCALRNRHYAKPVRSPENARSYATEDRDWGSGVRDHANDSKVRTGRCAGLVLNALRGLPDGETVLDRKSVERLWKDHVQLDKCIASLDEDGLIEILPGGGVRLPV